jgi:hypothetical protein
LNTTEHIVLMIRKVWNYNRQIVHGFQFAVSGSSNEADPSYSLVYIPCSHVSDDVSAVRQLQTGSYSGKQRPKNR